MSSSTSNSKEKKSFIVSCLVAAVVATGVTVVTSLTLARPPEKSYPAEKSKLEARRPEILLLGNSILDDAVDDSLLAQLTGLTTMKRGYHGSASAKWYLYTKNVLGEADYTPPYFALVFRDEFLTIPDYRVSGHYRMRLDEFSKDEEPLLEHLAYHGGTGTFVDLIPGSEALIKSRNAAVEAIEMINRDIIAGAMLSLSPSEMRLAEQVVFSRQRQDARLMNAIQQKAEEVETKTVPFEKKLANSFLPSIVRINNAKGSQLILIRMKRRADLESESSQPLKNYITALRLYAEENDIHFLDYTEEERLQEEHFAVGDHLEIDEGRKVFTKILAEDLNKLLAE